MIKLERWVERFLEYVDPEDPTKPGESFNELGALKSFDTVPYRYDVEELEDAARAIRNDGCSFDEARDMRTAVSPDGSVVIDYATGERERVTWVITDALWSEKIALIALADVTVVATERHPNGQLKRLVTDLKPTHFLRKGLGS